MDKLLEKKYLENEHLVWWNSARRDMIVRLVSHFDRACEILDVGCSGGAGLAALRQRGYLHTYGIDISSEAIEACRKKGLQNVSVMDAENPLFDAGKFDLLIASDVVEHLPNAGQALKVWNRIIKSGGTLIVFVPANKFLWSGHDVLAHHQQRYNRKELTALIEKAGFVTQRISGWNVFFFLPITLAILVEKAINAGKKPNPGASHVFTLPALLRVPLLFISSIENFFLERFNAPFGVSLFVIAKKP